MKNSGKKNKPSAYSELQIERRGRNKFYQGRVIRSIGRDIMGWEADKPSSPHLRRQCTAVTKRNASNDQIVRCGKPAEEGKDVCRFHGRDAGRPVADRNLSKYFNGSLVDAYNEFVDDPDINNLTQEVAAARTVLSHLITEDGLVVKGPDGAPNVEAAVKALELISRLILAKKKIEVIDKGNLTIDQVMAVMRQITHIVQTTCDGCPKLPQVAQRIGEIGVIRT